MHSVSMNGQHLARPWGDKDEDDRPCPQRALGLVKETESWTVLMQGRGVCTCSVGHGNGHPEKKGIWEAFLEEGRTKMEK